MHGGGASGGGTSRGWRWATVVVPAVLARDGHRCTSCGAPCPHPRHHPVDHIVPKHLGGTDALANLRTLCAPEHELKTKLDREGSS